MSRETDLVQLRVMLEEIDGISDALSEKLEDIIRYNTTKDFLGSEAVRFFEGMKIHVDNCNIAVCDMTDTVKEKLDSYRRWRGD